MYSNAHVDKANIASYDYSALLYLSTGGGADFEGGELAFLDADAERLVTPRAGRLVAFSSGLENLHRVREVTRGERFVLAMWFTCSAEHAYNDFAAADAEDGGGDALAAPDGPGRWASGLRDGLRPEL